MINALRKKSFVITAIFTVFLVVIVGLLYAIKANENEVNVAKVEVYKHQNGYAYKILYKNKVVINQPFIPAVAGKFIFCNNEDAEKTGELVKNRFILNKKPTITIKDIKRLEISLDCM